MLGPHPVKVQHQHDLMGTVSSLSFSLSLSLYRYKYIYIYDAIRSTIVQHMGMKLCYVLLVWNLEVSKRCIFPQTGTMSTYVKMLHALGAGKMQMP